MVGSTLDPATLPGATTRWTGEGLSRTAIAAGQRIPAFPLVPARRIRGIDLWDMWPIEQADGTPAAPGGVPLWLALTAPCADDPEARHAVARIRLVSERKGAWHVHGPAMPDGLSAGSREWSGSALFDPTTSIVTLFYTAAGRRGETGTSFEQRLFQVRFRLVLDGDTPRAEAPYDHRESIVADDHWYMVVNQREGAAGTIKALGDPGLFRDPASGRQYLLFTGSKPGSASAWNGVIGVAEAVDDTLSAWRLRPPLVSADGRNNELERPHLRHVGGLYYLFWSTQAKVFAPDGPIGPTGLYGMVGPSPLGPFTPLNGTGLVAANPLQAPFQAYSWWVMQDLRVTSFADLPEVATMDSVAEVAARRRHFGGYPAPWFRLELDGAHSRIA
ncbi:glycoside hydrolase family 68 protein [Sphingomonas elodea]|uniref:glycoside hydrolase family 68 protein n=1 Tax=Sphingomonas elodea TaxID=179878 RepID=UPI0002630716|nr:glycoside hydrolase family 68 protein [Sphingomonas elodea]